MPESAPVSIVSTILNDRAGCEQFFEQMLRQTRQPGEIVIVDAGSKDGTWEFLQAEAAAKRPWRLVALQERGCNIARGRNVAIQAARHEIIVSTDIGCVWEPEWLAELAGPLLENPQCEAVMGSWRVRWEDQRTPWAKADPMLRGGIELRAKSDSHASSRAIAYRKALWQKIGGYPEDLTLAGDDMVFALLLHKTARNVAAAPVPRCVWDRPQKLKSLLKEARRNFRGSGEAGIWLDYLCLVGGRIVAEWVSLIGLVASALAGAPVAITAGFGLLALLLSAWRLRSWLVGYRALRERGGGVSFWQASFMDYAARLWALWGYLEGLKLGGTQCTKCRERLRAVGVGRWSTRSGG